MNTRRQRLFACVLTFCGTPACVTLGWHAAASSTSPDEVAAFEQMPDPATRTLGLAVPASAPCHRGSGHNIDIVCPLVSLDATYYAAMNGATPADDDATGRASKTQVAEDE